MRPFVLSAVLLLVLAAPAAAEAPATRAAALVMLADSPAALRDALLAYADSAAAAADPAGAAEAAGYLGQSLQRAGLLDSAIVCYRRALALSPTEESALALIDQLLLRRGPGEVAEALELLAALSTRYGTTPTATIQGRVAWGQFLLGRADTAATLFARIARPLASHSEWRYRMARVALEREDYRRAADLLLPDAVRTRGTDEDVVGMLEHAGNAYGLTERLKREVQRQVAEADGRTRDRAEALGGRLLTLRASDGFTLGALLVSAAPPPRGRAPLLAVVLLSPGDSLSVADSLAAALSRHGVTTLVLEPRGTGFSVGPECPSPESWFSRDAALQARVARDVLDVARWARSQAGVDTTRVLLAGVGSSVTMVVEAATLEPRTKALLLVSPAPALVDRGPTRAHLARLQLPVFFQIAADDLYPALPVAEAFYQAGDRAASRVVESHMSGSGLAQFRDEPELARRFLAWLDAALKPSRSARPATPPGSRR